VDVHSAAHDAVAEHAERLLPMIDQLLADANLPRDRIDAVAFGQGPGGFTGLRVACGVAQGIALALAIPVIPVVSLHAAAAQDARRAPAEHEGAAQPVRVVVQDARMGEVYLGAYRCQPDSSPFADCWQTLQQPVLLSADDVGEWLAHCRPLWNKNGKSAVSGAAHAPVRVLGDGLQAYPQIMEAMARSGQGDVQQGGAVRATAEAVARIALVEWAHKRTVVADQAAPLYVRDKVAYTTLEREQGLGGNPRASEFTASRIDAMRSADLEQVLDIERAVQPFPWTRRNFQDALDAGYSAWVLRHDAGIAGFYLAMHAPDVTHLLLIAVAPGAQRRGMGTMLLEHCLKESLAHGLPRVILEVRPSNQKGLAFYGRHGFSTLSVRRGYYPTGKSQREDALVLEKNIASVADS
jgi:tRNA threonylcarbamoyladenosine biosynthesis protein TsaB